MYVQQAVGYLLHDAGYECVESTEGKIAQLVATGDVHGVDLGLLGAASDALERSDVDVAVDLLQQSIAEAVAGREPVRG